MTAEFEANLINRVAMGDMLRRRTRDNGTATALVDYTASRPQRMTFAELNDRAVRFGRMLLGTGARKGDRVIVLAPNCIDICAIMYGCFNAALVYVPANFMMNDDEIAYIARHAEPVCAVVHPSLVKRWERIVGLVDRPIHTLRLGGADEERVLASYPATPLIEGVIIHDRDPAQILYTSGTTSHPKGVVNSHLNLFISSLNMALLFQLGRGDSYASPLPLYHTAAQGHLLMTHQVGGMFVVSAFEPERFASILEGERINGVFLLPMMWKALMELPGIAKRDFSALKRGLYAMTAMSATLLDRLHAIFNCPFNQTSGQTETSVVTKYYDGAPVEFSGGNYWGRPAPIADQAILDNDGNEVPPGTPGEICWRSPSIMSEYFRDEEATANASRFGWHHSGDIGVIDDKGELLFLDRIKDMVKSGGENVATNRVERVLLEIPEVGMAAAVGLPHPKWDEAVTAFVTAAPGGSVCEQAVISFCRARLARFEIPKAVVVINEMPTTSTGKIRKHELRREYADFYADVRD